MYEPKYGPKKVVPVRAHCSERVRVTWTLPDGSTIDDYFFAPTPEVVEARRRKDEESRNRIAIERSNS
jgi:hypothetical protein